MSSRAGDHEDEPCPSAAVAVAHAWHAAEPEDEQRLLEHVGDCAVCESAITDAIAVGVALAGAVPSREPPPALRDRILAAAAREPDPPARRVPPDAPSHAAPARAVPDRAAPSEVPWRRSGRRVGGLMLVTVAVVLGVVLLAGRALLPGSPATDQASPAVPPDPASLAAQAARVVDEAEAADPGVRHAVLRDDGGRSVAVVLDGGSRQDAPRLVTLALAAPPAGRSWVLWGTGAGSPAALGVVDRSTGRTAGAVATAPEQGWRGFAVSQEPSGPVPDRPSEVLATGSVI